jgi:predicted GNAT family N-acyltransferase
VTRKLKYQRDDFRIEPLGKRHDRAAFSSDIEALDNYLKTQAGQDVSKRVAACFVLTPDGKTIAGFYTLSQYSVDAGALPQEITRKLPRYPEVPATLLGRLASSDSFRGQKLGEFLLMDALHRSLLQSEHVASAAVIVDAKDDKAKTFYEHFDFVPFPDIPNRLFLLMKTIEQLFTG